MKKFVFLVLAALAIICWAGCQSRQGSQEYVPGKGWRPS